MALVTVYDADGKAHAVEPVDAREYIACGSYFASPPAPAATVPAEEPEYEGFAMSDTSASATAPAPSAIAPPKRGRPPKQHPTE